MESASSPIRFAVALIVILVLLALARAAFAQSAAATTVRDAIGQAVLERIGGEGSVSVTMQSLKTAVPDAGPLTAVPEPGGRLGRPARFVLWRGRDRAGVAVARVDVIAPHVRTRRGIARAETIAAEDVQVVDAAVPALAFRPFLSLEAVVGTRPRRNLAAGEVITTAVITVPPAVRSGDVVEVLVRVGAVQVTGRGVASGSGQVGDVIRVINQSSRRPLRAKISGPNAVEVIR